MNRKKVMTVLLLSTVYGMCLFSCGNNTSTSSSSFEETYTIIWQNDNGDVLETDINVPYGTMPTYDGNTPTKESDEQYSYVFSGWTPSISEVTENMTYVATYTKNTNTFTITWQNYDGEVLEIDNNVPYKTMPTYDGNTPTKESDEQYTYIFSGWTPSISEVIENATYTATFSKRQNGELIFGIDPIISEDHKTVQYGFYPQTHVNDETLIEKLNSLDSTNSSGWYLYNDEYYTKEVAEVYNNESYTFDDGTAIENGKEYWYKCEIISWNILSDVNGNYFLLSSKLLDAHNFYNDYADRLVNGSTIYANNYEHSDIRTWLNNDFYNKAFTFNNTYIQETLVSNKSSTTDANMNPYVCSETKDKVYLPSYQDYLNLDYGFTSDASTSSSTRTCKTTDYARARGSWINTSKPDLKYNGSYWTRSPSSEFNYCAWNVNSGGYLSTYAVDGNSHSVRPCITINLV